MHHNLKIEMERVNNQYVTEIELSTAGRCGRARIMAPTFEEALDQLRAKHDELLANAQGFHSGTPASNITHHSEAQANRTEQTEDAPEDKKVKPQRPAKKSAKASKKAAPAAKAPARKFASE